MTSIIKATEEHHPHIAAIGRIAVEEAHRDSCSAEDMNTFLDGHYTNVAIQAELNDPNNIYHMVYHHERPVGFSKILLNAAHPNIQQKNAAKLDRIYLLSEFHGLKLGYEMLLFNIELARKNDQSGMWLFTWVGNTRAVNFYLKTGFRVVGSHKFKVTERHYNEHHQMFLDLS